MQINLQRRQMHRTYHANINTAEYIINTTYTIPIIHYQYQEGECQKSQSKYPINKNTYLFLILSWNHLSYFTHCSCWETQGYHNIVLFGIAFDTLYTASLIHHYYVYSSMLARVVQRQSLCAPCISMHVVRNPIYHRSKWLLHAMYCSQ